MSNESEQAIRAFDTHESEAEREGRAQARRALAEADGAYASDDRPEARPQATRDGNRAAQAKNMGTDFHQRVAPGPKPRVGEYKCASCGESNTVEWDDEDIEPEDIEPEDIEPEED